MPPRIILNITVEDEESCTIVLLVLTSPVLILKMTDNTATIDMIPASEMPRVSILFFLGI